MGMYDVQRITPPSHFIWHHAVSPDMRGWGDQDVANWFSSIGKTRTYGAAGYNRSDHYDLRTGQETFSAVPIALVPNGDRDDIYSDSWRVVEIFDWYNNIGWHCGDWEMNRRSVGCETAGRYDDKELPLNAVKALAEWMKVNIHRANNKTTTILGHKQIIATACPGSIMDKIPLLYEWINTPENPTAPIEPNAIYRFWSPKYLSHFYTSSVQERDALIGNNREWNYEGIAFHQPETGSPVFRFVNNNTKSHFYTSNIGERDSIIAHDPKWSYEGETFRCHLSRNASNFPIYRFYSPKYDSHFFTISKAERDAINSQYSDDVWRYEGVAFYMK